MLNVIMRIETVVWRACLTYSCRFNRFRLSHLFSQNRLHCRKLGWSIVELKCCLPLSACHHASRLQERPIDVQWHGRYLTRTGVLISLLSLLIFQEGLRVVRELGDTLGIPMHVFGPESHMTAIVGMALGKREIPTDVVDNSTTTANFLLAGMVLFTVKWLSSINEARDVNQMWPDLFAQGL